MSFFVVERGAADGTLRMPVPLAFDTREAALEALSAAVAAGGVIEGEVFVVDLGAALPVLVMPTPSPVPPVAAPEPVATGAEADVVAPVYDAWAEAVVSSEASADDDLALALKRAADSLEAEGIVAPASIDPMPAGLPTEWAPGAPTVVAEPAGESGPIESDAESAPAPALASDATAMADLSAALEGLGSAELPTDAGPVSVPDGEAPGSWPWTNVAPVAAADDAAVQPDEPRDLIAETVASLDEDSAQDVSMLAPVAEGDDAYVPRPVILGDYDDAPSPIADVPDTLADDTDGVLEYVAQSPEPDVSAMEQSTPEEAVEAPTGAWLTGATDEPSSAEALAPSESAPGYEAGAELDLGSYTCDDCVYSNTCPKVGQATPADCGSFQWRSE